MNIDLFFKIHNLVGQNPVLDFLMVFGAEYLIYLMMVFSLVAAITGGVKEIKTLLLIIVSIPIAILLIQIIHLFIFENRPFATFHFLPLVKEQANASFPSRHATISAVIAFSYIYFKSKWWLPYLLAMIWVGISRVYVGVHYPQDIIGGFATGIVAITIALQIKKLLKGSQIYYGL